jgi:hypothetical protein
MKANIDELKRLRDNKTSLWFWKVVFSSKFRCRELTKPTEVFIDEVKSNYVELKSTKDPERGFFIRVFYSYDSYPKEGSIVTVHGLCESKEECMDEYNASFMDQIDKVQSYSEEKIKYLKSKILKSC